MKKFLLTVVCLICFMPAIGFAACEPVNCNTSTGNDRLNADTLENTREARRTAASCYICEDNYEYHKLDKLINMTYDIINSGERITEYKRLLKYNETFYGEHSKDIYLSQLSRLNIAVFRYYLYGEFNDKGIINILEKCYTKLNKKA